MTYTHHIFVDLENVPSVDLDLIGALPVFVTILIGRTQTKLETALVAQIHAHASKVRLITLGTSGRNALDLTLAYYLGHAVAQNGDTQLHIISKDKDFEALITHLRGSNVTVSRSESFAALPFLAAGKLVARTAVAGPASQKPAPAANTPVAERAARIIARLKNPSTRNRPAREDALVQHVRTSLGKEVSDQLTKTILRQLQEERILTIEPNGKVIYWAT